MHLHSSPYLDLSPPLLALPFEITALLLPPFQLHYGSRGR